MPNSNIKLLLEESFLFLGIWQLRREEGGLKWCERGPKLQKGVLISVKEGGIRTESLNKLAFRCFKWKNRACFWF